MGSGLYNGEHMKEIVFEKTTDELTAQGAEQKHAGGRGPQATPILRTFSGDVENLVREKGITKTQVVMAEEARREDRGEARTVHSDDSHLTQIIFFLLLILAFGVGLGLYVLIGVKAKPVDTRVPQIKTERMYEVNITNTPREQILADIATAFSKTSYTPNESRVVAFTVTDAQKNNRDALPKEFLDALAETPIPDSLRRALGDTITLRVHGQSITTPLLGSLQFSIRSYPNTFAGMLEWENNMAGELIPSLDPNFSRNTLRTLSGRPFVDARVSGLDARVLRTTDGQVALAYVFVGSEHLVIAKNTDILASVILGYTEEEKSN